MFPETKKTLNISLPALVIIGASVILAVLLTIVTYRNVARELQLMERFLFREGETLIKAFEAGTRSSLMMHLSEDFGLKTLVDETVQSEAVSYITISDENGRIVYSAGDWSHSEVRPAVKDILENKLTSTSFLPDSKGKKVFELAREFTPLIGPGSRRRHLRFKMEQWRGHNKRMVIFVALRSDEFDAARKEELRHGVIMMGILFLVGSAGLYFIFLYQSVQVSRNTLENMELYTGNVIESMPAGLLSLDADGNIMAANGRMAHFFGKPVEETRGKTFSQLVGDENTHFIDLLEKESDFLEEPVDWVRPDGTVFPMKVSASGLRDREKERKGTVLIFRDLREIREMEEQLERSRRLASLGRIAAGIAHEIRNPLSTLRGFSQFFAKGASKHSAEREYAELMIGEIDRLNRIISSLLQFARPREPIFEPHDMRTLLEKSAKLLEEDCRLKQVGIELRLPEEPVSIPVDADLILQVLINLIKNSLAVLDNGGQITLYTGVTDEQAEFSVKDNGPGIPPKDVEHIFDPFFTTRKSGTGLGLAVVHQIVEQHKGQVEVESALGEGTLIKVVLPGQEQKILSET